MRRYILKRLLLMIPIILGVIVFVFTIIYISPGDAASVILGNDATEEEREELRDSMGLNDPYIVQLGRYCYNLFVKFDFGDSYISKGSVMKELMQRFPNTLRLAVASIIVSIGVGIPLGINAAIHQNKLGDYGSMVIALVGTSMPGFWLALMLVLIFAYKLGLLPAFGMGYTDISCTEAYYHRNRKKLEPKSAIISSLPEFQTKRYGKIEHAV